MTRDELDLSGMTPQEAAQKVRVWLEQRAIAATETFPPDMRDEALAKNCEAIEVAMIDARRLLQRIKANSNGGVQ